MFFPSSKLSWALSASIVLGLAFSSNVLVSQEKDPPTKQASEKPNAKKKVHSYAKSGLSFKYPNGWKVSSDQSFSSTRLAVIHGPENAIVTIQFTETSVADTLKEYAKEYSETAAESLKNFHLTEKSFGEPAKNRSGFRVIAEKFTLSDSVEEVETVSVPHLRVFMNKKFDDYSCFLVTQSSIAELKKTSGGFEMISKTLQWKQEREK